MSSIIKDGTGTGNGAKVDSLNRLHVASVSASPQKDAIRDGRYFGTNTGFLTLTSDNESAILYLKNTSDTPFFLDVFRLVVGVSTNGVGPGKIRIQVNPTGGTLISNAVAAPFINTNLASTNTFDGIGYVGVEGDTVTGEAGENTLLTVGAPDFYDEELLAVIPKGTSISVTYEPPTGNTSMEVNLNFTGYYIDEEL